MMANIVKLQQASIPIKSKKLFVGATYYYLLLWLQIWVKIDNNMCFGQTQYLKP